MKKFEFEKIIITPYSELLDGPIGLSMHKGGPIWPEWDKQVEVRHQRRNKLFDVVPEASSKPVVFVRETLFWCGAVTRHFGHQLADFTSRIACYKGMSGKLCFAVHPRHNINKFEDTPIFFQKIIKLLGYSKDDIYIVSQNIIAEKLICCPQMEQLGGPGPSQDYLSILDALNPSLPVELKNGIYYISRAAQSSGVIAGELYIESILGKAGVKVIRPECISLEEQLRIYGSAKLIIFSEGSSMHALQILGRINCDVVVINRRDGGRFEEDVLKPRVKSLKYYSLGEFLYGLNDKGYPVKEAGLIILDPKKIISLFSNHGIYFRHFNEDVFLAISIDDIEQWVLTELNVRGGNKSAFDLIESKLYGCNLFFENKIRDIRLMYYSHISMRTDVNCITHEDVKCDYDIDYIRNKALMVEESDLELAYKLMLIAHEARPYGDFIKSKILQYEKKLKRL